MDKLLERIKQCQLCQDKLPLPAKPILQISKHSKILIAGQAPGITTHHKGIPFDDRSGDRLRSWLGVDKGQFYDKNLFAIIPMGFCYPGKGKSGDLPPIAKCAQTWHRPLMAELSQIELKLVLGKYACKFHLQSTDRITDLVQRWQQLLAKNILVLPHPSPRNNIWLKRNPWFEREVIPHLQSRINQVLNHKASKQLARVDLTR